MEVGNMRDLAGSIRARRRQLGWTQAALAEKVGVRRYWIIDVEKGKSTAEVGLVLRALRALGLTIRLQPRDHLEATSEIDLSDLLDGQDNEAK
jgi:HTH-type transcriptional regulator/antitoxin HipB